ncbi:MAG: hypothetical protein FJ100_20060 [Deltaproteobacteria bacterium]|nr:hypothetical protein [Deltaproteobacteria bacterium]
MDPDFLRELLVLAVFIGLYVFGSAAMLRGHKVDLSAVAAVGTRRAIARTDGGEVRLNRRRKARLREAQARGEAAGSDVETNED